MFESEAVMIFNYIGYILLTIITAKGAVCGLLARKEGPF